MHIAKVVGHIVSTQKDPRLIGCKLLTIVPMERKGSFQDTVVVSVDAVGAGIGETVLVVTGKAARLAIDVPDAPVDCAIVGIIDTIDIS